MARHRHTQRCLALAAAACAALALAAPAQAARTATVTTVMTIQSQQLYQPYSWQDPTAFGVDDFMNWTVTGQLAPGDSYTFVPKWPISSASEVPAMSSSVRWSGSTTLRLTTTVPTDDQVTAADPSVDHRGALITAPVISNSAQLCMFFVPDNGVPTFNYALTVTNVGTVAATAVTLTGQTSNGYTSNFGPFCNRADADGDGWNDTLEEGMTDLTQPAVSTAAEVDNLLGVDYLAGRSATGTPGDEVDSYPPDVNDDGAVTQADVTQLSSWVGQGTGVPLARVDYTGVGAYSYQQQSALWRRYDLNGDGQVDSADVAWVQAEVGRPVPDPVDMLAPAVRFDRSGGTSFPRRSGVVLGAYARDNRALASVKFAVNGSTLTQQCTDPSTEFADQATYHNPAQPQYQCVWMTPSKSGGVTLKVTATDAAGNSSTDTVQLNVT
jgi:hypothetical protein